MAEQPTKSDIAAIFKRLRSIPTNKQCFDCNSNNPTWASITYGVFLCIDCSAVHRSLGVHVTFIRSTQLDLNWTWLQLRAMQVGSNANAMAFFRQHGCTSSDAQQKYHSRAATMYKDKLHSLATQAMRMHGAKLHLDSGHHHPTTPVVKEVDFFTEHVQKAETNGMMENAKLSEPQNISNGNGKKTEEITDSGNGPSVEAALSMSPTIAAAIAEPRRIIIGAKKPTAAKKGKGFGAQKVTTDFSEIENKAQRLDKERETLSANMAAHEAKTKDEQEKQMASMRLAYKDMDIQRKKQEEKIRSTDPKKAEQLERLGMGLGNRGVSHSAIDDMTTISQQKPHDTGRGSNGDRYERSHRRDFFDDEFEHIGGLSSGPPKYNDSPFGSSRNDDWGSSSSKKSGNSWDIERFESKQSSIFDSIPSKSDDRTSRSRKTIDVAPMSDDAQKKFAGAKAISSDMYFGDRDSDFETKQAFSRFEGSSSISSSDFYGGGKTSKSSSSYSNTPDFEDIKEGVRQGVTKVAGKLSSLANGVVSSLQDKYGS